MDARTKLLSPLAAIATALLVTSIFGVAQPGGGEEPPADDTPVEPALAEADTPAEEESPAYTVLYQFEGVLSCGVGTGAATPDPAPGASADLCFLQTWSPGGWTMADPAFEAPAGARAAVLELSWGPPATQLEGDTLSLTAPSALETPFESGDVQTARGTSILRLDVPAADPAGTSGAQTVRVQPGYDLDSGVVMNKPWELRATVFVGMDVPAGYSAYALG